VDRRAMERWRVQGRTFDREFGGMGRSVSGKFHEAPDMWGYRKLAPGHWPCNAHLAEVNRANTELPSCRRSQQIRPHRRATVLESA